MFWRLYLAYLGLVVLTVVVVGVLILQHTRDDVAFLQIAGQVLPGVAVVLLIASIVAYALTKRFIAPVQALESSTRQLAEGDFSRKISVVGGPEFTSLARSFNAMTERLSTSFQEIAHDREQLRAILSGLAEGVIALDGQQHVLFANDSAGKLLEFNPLVAVGRTLWESSRHRELRQLVEKAAKSNTPQRGEIEWGGVVEKHLTVYVAKLGQSYADMVVVMHDLTEMRRLERLRQDFVANVSHELKTPLSNIKSSVETLMDGAVEDPNSRGMFLAEIMDQATRQQMLIEDLLSLARVESAEKLGYDLVPLLLDDAVQNCLDRHRTRAEAKGLTLDSVALAGTPANLMALADDEGLAQLLDNLLDNAIKYTPDNGRVILRWQSEGALVKIEVEDTGIGIPEADLPRVFERFYRVDKARSREMGGTGLGLAIVKHLAQAMKGSVSVSSELGVGTKFLVTLNNAIAG